MDDYERRDGNRRMSLRLLIGDLGGMQRVLFVKYEDGTLVHNWSLLGIVFLGEGD
jgi:hypothetical protein